MENQPSKYYRSISELPLSRFIDCDVDGNLRSLVLEGNPSAEQLQEAWEEIKVQVVDTVNDSESKRILSLTKQVTTLTVTLSQIEIAVEGLSNYLDFSELVDLSDYSMDFFRKELNKLLSTFYKFDINDPESYRKELKNAYNRSRGLKITLDLRTIDLGNAQKKVTGGVATREYYERVLVELTDDASAGFEFTDSMSTYKFFYRLNRLVKKSEAANTKKNGK